MNNLFNFLIFGGIYLTFFLLLEYCGRKKWMTHENTRRIAHLGSALLTCLLPDFLERTEIILLAAGFLVILTISKKKNLFSAIHEVTRTTLGELFFPVAVAANAFLLLPDHPEQFRIVMLIMGMADVGANITGQYFPRMPYTLFNNTRTISGSMVFTVITAAILGFTTDLDLSTILLFSVILAVTEGLSPYGSDNLTITVMAILLLL